LTHAMKSIRLFHFKACPYCREVYRWLDEVKAEDPELHDIPVELIDERLHPDIASRYDYWYVPAFYVDGEKVHEGVCSKDKVRAILRMAKDYRY
jgi:glutaredoxin